MLAFHFQKLDHSHFLFCRRRKSRKGQEKQTPQAKTNKHNQETRLIPLLIATAFARVQKTSSAETEKNLRQSKKL